MEGSSSRLEMLIDEEYSESVVDLSDDDAKDVDGPSDML